MKRRVLSTSIAAFMGAFPAAAVHAQDDINTLEEVIVTGIRASLDRAMDIKRDSQGVVDAISAEDIGEFPDTNLAESLQRITGVSIDRQNNEGSRVTVRGFGPDYNMITLNGRQMPTANLGETGTNNSRSFDFSQLAAESVSAVEIYKTGRADLTTGGIGSTINIKTSRPLESPGLISTFGVKAVADSTNRVATMSPLNFRVYIAILLLMIPSGWPWLPVIRSAIRRSCQVLCHPAGIRYGSPRKIR